MAARHVALLAGYVFQAVALANGRLAVIQPLLVTTIVFALPLGYFLTNQVIHRREVVGAAVVVLGLAVFTVVGEAADGNDNAPAREWAIAVLVFSLIAVALLVAGGRGGVVAQGGPLRRLRGRAVRAVRCALQADGGDPRRRRRRRVLPASWGLYAFALAGIVAFVVQQVSLATGKLAASVATVSVCNPLVGIVIGTLLLDERLSEPTWHKVVAYSASRCRPRGRGRHLHGDRGSEGAKERGARAARPPAT